MNAGLTRDTATSRMVTSETFWNCPMDTPAPRPSSQPLRGAVDEEKIRAWLKLRHEMAELHARLEYLKLMLTIGVQR